MLREQYRREVVDGGAPLAPSEANRAMQQASAQQGLGLPNVSSRVRATNANIEAFVQQHGRMPVSQEEWARWVYRNTGTLAVPAAVAGSQINNLLADYSGELAGAEPSVINHLKPTR